MPTPSTPNSTTEQDIRSEIKKLKTELEALCRFTPEETHEFTPEETHENQERLIAQIILFAKNLQEGQTVEAPLIKDFLDLEKNELPEHLQFIYEKLKLIQALAAVKVAASETKNQNKRVYIDLLLENTYIRDNEAIRTEFVESHKQFPMTGATREEQIHWCAKYQDGLIKQIKARLLELTKKTMPTSMQQLFIKHSSPTRRQANEALKTLNELETKLDSQATDQAERKKIQEIRDKIQALKNNAHPSKEHAALLQILEKISTVITAILALPFFVAAAISSRVSQGHWSFWTTAQQRSAITKLPAKKASTSKDEPKP